MSIQFNNFSPPPIKTTSSSLPVNNENSSPVSDITTLAEQTLRKTTLSQRETRSPAVSSQGRKKLPSNSTSSLGGEHVLEVSKHAAEERIDHMVLPFFLHAIVQNELGVRFIQREKTTHQALSASNPKEISPTKKNHAAHRAIMPRMQADIAYPLREKAEHITNKKLLSPNSKEQLKKLSIREKTISSIEQSPEEASSLLRKEKAACTLFDGTHFGRELGGATTQKLALLNMFDCHMERSLRPSFEERLQEQHDKKLPALEATKNYITDIHLQLEKYAARLAPLETMISTYKTTEEALDALEAKPVFTEEEKKEYLSLVEKQLEAKKAGEALFSRVYDLKTNFQAVRKDWPSLHRHLSKIKKQTTIASDDITHLTSKRVCKPARDNALRRLEFICEALKQEIAYEQVALKSLQENPERVTTAMDYLFTKKENKQRAWELLEKHEHSLLN